MIGCQGAFYGLYRSCRDAAWRCQLEFDVCALPVRVKSIAHSAGIRVIRERDVGMLHSGELAVSIYDGENWTIVYDDSLDTAMIRFVTAHELGHIFLGHEYKFEEKRFALDKGGSTFERDADMFATRLLAPAIVLHELGAFTPDNISELCGIPLFIAKERAKRMAVLEKRGCFYKSPMERSVYDRFKPFIDEKRAEDTQV